LPFEKILYVIKKLKKLPEHHIFNTLDKEIHNKGFDKWTKDIKK
jgi:hypothetical protein